MARRLTTTEFIEKAKNVHGDKYDYSNVRYVNKRTKVKIVCIEHGMFEQTPDIHLNQESGCFKCGLNLISKKNRLGNDRFIKKSKKIHGDKYNYSLVEYINAKNKIKIKCRKHGIFNQSPNDHLNGCGCPKCNESNGERKIRLFLENKNLDFIYQKKFDNCVNIKKLPFDFYLPKKKLLIEFDGEQHYSGNNFFGLDSHFKTKNNDKIKNKFCHDNKLDLIRIPFYEINNLEKILNKIL